MKKLMIIFLLSFLSISWVLAYGWLDIPANQSLFFEWKKVWPYKEVSNLHKLWDNWFQYTYNNWPYKYYININWKDFWPYTYVWLAKSFNNWYVYYYRLLNKDWYNQDDYINVNWKIFWPFNEYSDWLSQIWDNWYYIKYLIWDKYYININWKEYWPFDDVDINSSQFDNNYKYSFYYTKNNQKFINIDEKEYWPYDDISDINNWNFKYIKNNKAYIFYSWKKYWPYDKWNNFTNLWPSFISYSLNKVSGFSYIKNDKYHINIDWKEYWPFDAIYYDTENFQWKGFAFRYVNDTKNYININDKIYWPFDEIERLWLLLNNFYSYTYLKEWNKTECSKYIRGHCIHETKKMFLYLNINGKEYWPYEKYNVSKIKKILNSYYFIIASNEWYYININNKEYWPYKYVNENYVEEWYLFWKTKDNKADLLNKNWIYKTITDISEFQPLFFKNSLEVFTYIKWDKKYININGEEFLYPNNSFVAKVLWNKWYIYAVNKNWKSYINVNNKNYWPYDKPYSSESLITLNNFYWFTYQIDWKKYVNINDKNYWPYNKETDVILKKIWNDWIWYETIQNYWTTSQLFNKYYIKNNIIKKNTNPKIDRLLNKIFIKIDKKWKTKAKIVYQWLIKKIELLVNKTKTDKNKELLNYIKEKILEKIK